MSSPVCLAPSALFSSRVLFLNSFFPFHNIQSSYIAMETKQDFLSFLRVFILRFQKKEKKTFYMHKRGLNETAQVK